MVCDYTVMSLSHEETNMNVTLNQDQKLFVISTGNSVSCMGFRVVFEQACELARRLAKVGRVLFEPLETEVGTLTQYTQYQKMMGEYVRLGDNKTWFDARTPKKVQSVLEAARKEGTTVRVFLGSEGTGRDWLSEYDTIGRIGRSMGPMKAPLLVPKGDCGGPALLTDCILRVIDMDTGKELYRHAKYHTPKMELTEAASYDVAQGYTHSVKVESEDGVMECHANFKSQAEAAHWLAFMSGHSHDYPTGD